MKKQNLITMGIETFKIFALIERGLKISQIIKITKKSAQNINNIKKDLLDLGWIEGSKGIYKLTNAGRYFFKTVYLNPILKGRLEHPHSKAHVGFL